MTLGENQYKVIYEKVRSVGLMDAKWFVGSKVICALYMKWFFILTPVKLGLGITPQHWRVKEIKNKKCKPENCQEIIIILN